MNEESKLNLKSMSISDEKKAQLKQLFPEVFSENKVDFERLKLVLGENIETGKERYGMTWAGKNNCFKIIQKPSEGTLKPCVAESVNFERTENIFIEGDNLEVLKLLQKSYYAKVKLIYIDPPYNTGNEFIYPDNFSESLDTYLKYTGQKDAEGKKFSTNVETDGRFHSKWINMMYPRLYLAKNLLRSDGAICVSVDDHEISNLKKICDEIFGEEKHVATITVINNMKGRNDKANVATCHEYLVIYGNIDFTSYGLPLSDEQLEQYKFTDENGKKYALRDLRKRGRPDRREDRPNMFFPVFFNQKKKSCSLKKQNADDVEIVPLRGDGSDGRWRWGLDRVTKNISFLHPKYNDSKKRWSIEHRVYLDTTVVADDEDDDVQTDLENVNDDAVEVDDGDQDFSRTSKSKSFWWGGEISTDVANRAFKRQFDGLNPDYPKSPYFIERILNMCTKPGDLVLDFFAGYCTTADAVNHLNATTDGGRKFICVQLPEKIQEKSEFRKKGYNTIADVAKERIRRVINKIKDEIPESKADLGFKVFKLSQSNFKIWETDHEQNIPENLKLYADHIDPNAKQEDLLYEILLNSRLELTTKVEKVNVCGQEVFSVEDGTVFVYLGDSITKELTYAIAEKVPLRFICLDHSFHHIDQLKTNTVQLMKSRNIEFRTV